VSPLDLDRLLVDAAPAVEHPLLTPLFVLCRRGGGRGRSSAPRSRASIRIASSRPSAAAVRCASPTPLARPFTTTSGRAREAVGGTSACWAHERRSG
jgi:hypothetical protein